ncbi:MAG: CCA tRNA nucleotidyltransferase [Candidatus Omnitrophica bacterium]|nr:CCA tRNA nucleotidyltransferase [Candidatus Omnitrophota bacterium]
MSLKEKIIRIPYLSDLNNLSKSINVEVYLVGGFLRDIYMKRSGCFDFDFAVSKKVLELSRRFSKRIKGKLIVLDEGERIYRVILKKTDKIYIYDFSQLKGATFKEDVLRRDFSINTLGVKIDDISRPELLDYLGARKDLKKKLIRVVAEEVLIEDPLRILRAFSLSARFVLKIGRKTSKLLAKHRKLLGKVSGERINEELFKILGSLNSYRLIKKMSDLFILDEIIPYISGCRGVSQGGYHHLNVWDHSLETLFRFELLYKGNLSKNKVVADYLNEELSGNRRRIQILKLACLLHDIGKPLAKKEKDKRTIFHAHEKIGRDLAQTIALKLKLSSREKEVLKKMIFWHLRPGYLADEVTPSRRAIYRFFRDTQEEGAGVIILSLADWRATRGPLTDRKRRAKHEKVMLRLINKCFQEKEKKPLPKIINGFEIMKKFKLEPSLLIGKVLKKIKEEQALGNVSNKREAYALAKTMIAKEHRSNA